MMTTEQRADFQEGMQRLATGIERQHDEALKRGDYAKAERLADWLRETAAGLRWLKVRPEFTARGPLVN